MPRMRHQLPVGSDISDATRRFRATRDAQADAVPAVQERVGKKGERMTFEDDVIREILIIESTYDSDKAAIKTEIKNKFGKVLARFWSNQKPQVKE